MTQKRVYIIRKNLFDGVLVAINLGKTAAHQLLKLHRQLALLQIP